MALSRKVNHTIECMVCKKLVEQICVLNAAFDKGVIRMTLDICQVGQISSIGQGIEIYNARVGLRLEQSTNDMRPNESSTSSDQK